MNAGSSVFMLVGSTGLVILLGLPLLISPMRWARKLGWKIPEETDLANYLGRSLGGVCLSIAVVGYLAVRNPWQYRPVFELVIILGVFGTGVHVYGLIRESQPVVENLEIVVFLLISALAWYFYPHPPA
jgi:hypothetical protein